jgi:hypothetical protein
MEPDDEILPLLEQFREEFRAFRNQFMESMDEVSNNLVQAKERLASITKGLEFRREPPDLTKAIAETITIGSQGVG